MGSRIEARGKTENHRAAGRETRIAPATARSGYA